MHSRQTVACLVWWHHCLLAVPWSPAAAPPTVHCAYQGAALMTLGSQQQPASMRNYTQLALQEWSCLSANWPFDTTQTGLLIWFSQQKAAQSFSLSIPRTQALRKHFHAWRYRQYVSTTLLPWTVATPPAVLLSGVSAPAADAGTYPALWHLTAQTVLTLAS